MALSNNLTRIIVAVITIPVILAASYFGKIYFFIFVLGIALLSYYEFTQLAKNKGANVNIWIGFIAILFFLLNTYVSFASTYNFIILLIVIISILELFRNKGSAIINIGSNLLGIFYIGIFATTIIGIREFYPKVGDLYLQGGLLIICIFASIWVCDSAAYWGGSALGKHKLFPRVSPKKSWEGSIFGFLFAIITMILAKTIVLDFLSWPAVIVIGIIVGTIGQLGDLVESLIKRDAEVKDSSNIIPGHGGIFDRFDSLLLTAPVIYLYLTYFER